MTLASIQGPDRMMAEASTIQLQGRNCTVMRYARASSVPASSTPPNVNTSPTAEYCSWYQIAELLVSSASFRQLWNRTLATPNTLTPKVEQYQWKPVPIHPCTADRPFFAVLVPTHFAAASPTAYQSHFAALPSARHVAVFPNLSGASILVSPAPEQQAEQQRFGHLADFCRTASPNLTAEFWQQVGTLALERVRAGQIAWCNTHGHGVPWLHVRFDRNHKYASFPPYGTISPASQQEWYALYERAFGDRIPRPESR